jgi:D-sedoheptulose 7-phosphate isomerase
MDKILSSVKQAVAASESLLLPESLSFIEKASQLIADTFQKGGKILIAGNGGSLCDANHFAEELTGFYRKYRQALPAIALSESGHITCVGNDIGFEWVFARGVEAFGKEGDVFIALTTSGNSPNLLRAVESAKTKNLKTIAFLGKGGGKLKGSCDLELIINGFEFSDRIQEAHMAAIHIIIEMIELKLFVKNEVAIH